MSTLTKTEQVTLNLIKSDLLFLYTVHRNQLTLGESYYVALLPYIGMVIDGCETWSNKVAAFKNNALKFSVEEKLYYSELRNSIKLWNTNFPDLVNLLKEKYQESDYYFSHACKPLAKKLKLYDIFGSYIIDGAFCDNTILDMLFVPRFDFNHINGDYIKSMSEFSGKIIHFFGVSQSEPLEINHSIDFCTKDFGGFVKSPIGNQYSNKFVLFSMLCAINFVLYGIDSYIISDTSTKLRFAYIQYYYLLHQLPQINSMLKTNFSMDNQWEDSKGDFRSCMAHYGIGVVLRQEEVDETDLFGGLTVKMFGVDWKFMKNSITKELNQLAQQIKLYLQL